MTISETSEMVTAATAAELERVAEGYDTFVDFDGVLSRYAGKVIGPRIQDLRTLECGAASGVMTQILVEAASELQVVEASKHYASGLRSQFGDRIEVHNVLLEDFKPNGKFDAIIIAGLLHHLSDPGQALSDARRWLVPNGTLYVTVPNMLSFHRRLHVAMGGSETSYVTSDRNERFHQPGRFDRDSVKALLGASGWDVVELSGFFFKPFPHERMEQLELSDGELNGLFEMGRQHPEMACQIFAAATPQQTSP